MITCNYLRIDVFEGLVPLFEIGMLRDRALYLLSFSLLNGQLEKAEGSVKLNSCYKLLFWL
jgi:hypothetical protein